MVSQSVAQHLYSLRTHLFLFDSNNTCFGFSIFYRYAYAGINSWYSVFNDDACTSVSAQMHELGHNFYLAHSNEGSNAYDDKTGMMGISYGQDDTSMCFNPGKSWQLGWYQDKNVFLDPQSTTSFRADLVGVEHY